MIEDDEEHEVGGRVAAIIRWLLAIREEVNERGEEHGGEIIVCYKGSSLKASHKRIEKLS